VLHALWGGPPRGIRTHAELLAIADRREFVERLARPVLREKMPAGVRAWMPPKYLELEETRLIDLIAEWLEYEAARLPFTVAATEVPASPTIASLALDLRLDRIDRLNDGSLLVIDYKSGCVSPKSWELPRPDDVQLPLYASFGLDQGAELGGLVFAKVHAAKVEFAGRVGDAKATLLPELSGTSGLAKNRLTAEDLIGWREYIEQMARDFLAGRAEVDPRKYPETCERCGLQTLCRIQEAGAQFEAEDDAEDSEADDE
jgi:RecB family exonuclease